MFWNGYKWPITSISDTGTSDCETINFAVMSTLTLEIELFK